MGNDVLNAGQIIITIAESLDLPFYSLKYLLNYSMGNDITRSYIMIDVDRVCEPMQKITDHIESLCLTNNKEEELEYAV